MALKGKKPEVKKKRLKLFLFGDYGVGKTTAAISFPNSYIIDCEKGAHNKKYVDLINKNNSAYMDSTDADEVIEEVRALTSEKHPYKTIVIDTLTSLESDLMQALQKKYPTDDDMRIWRDRDKILGRLNKLLLLKTDLNVIATSHVKPEYGEGMKKLGTIHDGWKKWPRDFDIVIELKKQGKERMAYVKKSRVDEFEDGENFKWSYQEFQKRYGEDLEREAEVLKLASPENIQEIARLVGLLKISDDTIAKWNSKAQADSWPEYSDEAIQKCINYCRGLIEGGKNKEKAA